MRCYEGKENYIFISYAHKDSEQVMPIVEALHDASFRVWYDAGIEAGSEWPENVAQHLCDSKVVLVFLSKNALDSQNCIREIHFAISERKDILVVYLEELKLTAGMRMQLGPLQAMFLNRLKTKEEFLSLLLESKILASCKKPASKKSAAPREKRNNKAHQAEVNDLPAVQTVQRTPTHAVQPYNRIPLKYFDRRELKQTVSDEEIKQTKTILLDTLAEFNITGVKITSVNVGPTVTRYNLHLLKPAHARKIVACDYAFALNLHTCGVNVYACPEKEVVCVEIPNKQRTFIPLGNLLADCALEGDLSHSLTFPLGKDVTNKTLFADICKMPHMLIAGSSGSGKSVFLYSLIISLIYNYSPEQLRFIFIDPKRVELYQFNGLPHLMIDEIITDAGKAVQSLNWAITEMDRRYALMEEMTRKGDYVVNLDQYNEKVDESQRLPKIVIVIDEISDLMLFSKKKVETRIQTLTQKARAAGIHLILTTQRPSTDVISGVIKANIPTRIAFTVATDADSRIILDKTGAQHLLGKGDFLYTSATEPTPVRIQGAYLSYDAMQKVLDYVKENNKAETTCTSFPEKVNEADSIPEGWEDGDPLRIEALRLVIENGIATLSLLQRKLSIGYNRAGKIVDWMTDMGYVSPYDGAKARQVLITKEEFENKYGPF